MRYIGLPHMLVRGLVRQLSPSTRERKVPRVPLLRAMHFY
jgi:hypothetical protein